MEEAATPQPEDVGAGADPFPITEEDAAAVEALPSDVEAAVLHLRELNPLGGLVLRDHVYSVIENRTRVDAELRRLRQENRIRIMHVPPSSARLMSGEVAIVLAEDLQAALDAVARVGSGKSVSTSPDNAALLGRFRCQVLDRCTATSVTQAAIEELLEGGQTSAKKRKRLGCCGEEIKRLIASGFLRPRRDVDAFEQEAFWFSVPAMGPFVQSLAAGRAEVLAMIKRTARKELRLRDLEKRSLKKSLLKAAILVTDLAVRGDVSKMDSAFGPVLRLSVASSS